MPGTELAAARDTVFEPLPLVAAEPGLRRVVRSPVLVGVAYGLQPPQLVGRATEMADIRRVVEDTARGHGAVVVLTGEAGVGKSRLLGEVASCAGAAGLVSLRGTAVEGGGAFRPISEALVGRLRDGAFDESPGLRPFRAALARIVPGWADESAGAGVDSSLDPVVVLGEGLLRLLHGVGGDGGCALLLDDLHWADVDTLAVVDFLAGAVEATPVLVVATARRDDPSQERLSRLYRNLGVTVQEVERLDADDIGRLVASCVQDVQLPDSVNRFVFERSEGLPLLAEELLVGLVDAGVLVRSPTGWEVRGELVTVVPPTLAGLVAERLAELAPAHRRVVDAAAVIGREVDWMLLQPATSLSEDLVLAGLAAAADHHLLVAGGSPGRLRWRHALTRDAVLARLAPGEHAVLARRVAVALERRAGSTEDTCLAADLFARAGEPRRAAALLQVLARRAASIGALGSADEQLARAAQLDGALVGVAADRVRVLTLSGRTLDATEVGASALDASSGDEHAELCLCLARAAVAGGRWVQAGAYLDRAGRPDDPRALAVAADVAFGAGQPARAVELARRAVPLAERASLPEDLCASLEVIGRCARQADPDAAVGAFARAAQVAAEHGLVPARISALMGLGTVELLSADVSPRLVEARELALDAGMLRQVCSIDLLLADSVTVVDGPAAGSVLAVAAAELAGGVRLSGLQAMAELMSASGPAVAGDAAEMAARLDRAESRPHAPVEIATLRPWITALGPLVANDLQQARDFLDDGLEQLTRHHATAPLPHWGLWALVRTVLADRDGSARETLRAAPAVLRSANRGALMFADAVAAGRAGHHAEAASGFADADRILATQHWWRRLLRLLACQAAITDGWGDPVSELRADLTAFEANGDDRLARTCRDQLRRAGVTVRRGRGTASVPPWLRALDVTSREMDVLMLLIDRLSNAQVADRLYLSARTVETHVSSLLSKTGTTTRNDLVAFIARRPPNPGTKPVTR